MTARMHGWHLLVYCGSPTRPRGDQTRLNLANSHQPQFVMTTSIEYQYSTGFGEIKYKNLMLENRDFIRHPFIFGNATDVLDLRLCPEVHPTLRQYALKLILLAFSMGYEIFENSCY
jgi:hypothetical protein